MDQEPLSGKIVRVDKYSADVEVNGYGNARVDISTVRKSLGLCQLNDLRDVLVAFNSPVAVRVAELTEEKIAKMPEHIRLKVAQTYRWEAWWIKREVSVFPRPSEFALPAKYFTDFAGSDEIPLEYVARIISAVQQITRTWNDISLVNLLHLVKKHYKIRDIPDLHTSDTAIRSLIQSQPQYFSIHDDNVRRHLGFTEDEFKDIVKERCLETAANSDQPQFSTSATLAIVPATDRDYVIKMTTIIESLEEAETALRPILDASDQAVTIVGLDCEGVKLGKPEGCLTIVQISTTEGKVYVFDVFKNPQLLSSTGSLKRLLEDTKLIKVIHDCKNDAFALSRHFNVMLQNIYDTSIATRALMEQVNQETSYRMSFKDMCSMLGEEVTHKDEDFKTKMLETPDFWKIRPLSEEMIFYAAADALYLVPNVYQKLDGMLTSTWRELAIWSCKDTLKQSQQLKQQGGVNKPSSGHRGGNRRHRGRRGAHRF